MVGVVEFFGSCCDFVCFVDVFELWCFDVELV